jgi:hypothetical protein
MLIKPHKQPLVLTILMFLASCTSPDKARKTLEDEGYSHIQIGGWSPYGCAHGEGGDSTCTKFEARGPSGRKVRGEVGCGYLLKGCTVRIIP